ncbi:MAG TPA: flagellar basal-body rod protein FlgG [Anaerolineae bacterium]|nr:flagellar basal-body rod protein FlgG [Anaerolineae bacterium]
MEVTSSVAALFQIAASGLRAQQRQLDVIANNLANVNTVSFKRSRVNFQAQVKVTVAGATEGTPSAETMPTTELESGVELAAVQRVFTQGAIEPTGNPWDLALDGPGFFQVQRQDGGIGYTRDGTFHLDHNGQVVTAAGLRLLPEITVPANARELFIDRDGRVLAHVDGEVQELGTIQLARFTNPEGLLSIGDNLYAPTAASGPAQVGQAGSPGYGQIVPGALESANVTLAEEMIDLIAVQRAYRLSLQALQVADKMYELANNVWR